jgi:DNA-binding MarR family transcriptional regulator
MVGNMRHMPDQDGRVAPDESRAEDSRAEDSRAEDEDYDLIERALGRLLRVSRGPRFGDAIRGRAGIKLDRASYGVLERTGALAPVRLSELAQELGVDVSTASRQVQALEQKGLVDREPDPVDGRAMLLQLTRKGKAVRSKMQAAWQETIAGVLINWKPDDVTGLAALLDRFTSDLASFEDADEV